MKNLYLVILGQSPSHPSPGYPQDPYQSMPQTPRSQDQYAITPTTPRPIGSSPTGRKPVDPYSQPPMTPRPGDKDMFRSPVRGQDQFGQVLPGMQHDPSFPQVPRSQAQPGMWPGPDGDPYAQNAGAQMQKRGHQMHPPLERQMSAPVPSGPVTSREDPFAFSGQDHPEISTASDPFAIPPSTPGAPPLRGPRPQMHRIPSMQPEMHMPGPQMRPFRHPGMRLPTTLGDQFAPGPHQGPPRPRLEAPGQHPGQHPGLRPPLETSAVSHKFKLLLQNTN